LVVASLHVALLVDQPWLVSVVHLGHHSVPVEVDRDDCCFERGCQTWMKMIARNPKVVDHLLDENEHHEMKEKSPHASLGADRNLHRHDTAGFDSSTVQQPQTQHDPGRNCEPSSA
jgi:hypothetical protein